jgi:hypothetical protein
MSTQYSGLLGHLWKQAVEGKRSWLLLAVAPMVVSSLVFLTACAGGTGHPASVQPPSPGTPVPPSNPTSPTPPPNPNPPTPGAEIAHGIFILDPPVSDSRCLGIPAGCFSQHLVPTLLCAGNGTPAGYGCSQTGAGQPYVKGAAFHVNWGAVNPSDGVYDFHGPDGVMRPWTDAGKFVSFVFEPTSFATINNVTPDWYMARIPIATLVQVGGVITLQTGSDMSFFPGGIAAAAGLEIQIQGTGTILDSTQHNAGIWKVCDHTGPSGCKDPDPLTRTITAIGSGSDILPVVNIGAVGNPVYGSNDGSTCTSGMLPIQWRPNFIRAWQNLIQQAVAHYASVPNVAYLRFGMGIGGQTNPTNGLSAEDPRQTACQAQMTKFGFTSAAAPWPAPSSSGWDNVSANWTAYLQAMVHYEESLSSPKAIIMTISPIQFGPVDHSTPDAVAAAAAAAHIGFGNQGLDKNDAINYANGIACYGGDWCSNFKRYHGEVPLELQTLFYSDPSNGSQTGSLVNSVPFATTMGVNILELYAEDWMCTYDSSWNNNNTYAACTSAGYPAVLSAAAAKIN